MKRILIIDDEESALDLLRRILEQEGHEVAAARNGQEGVEIFRRQQFDLVVTDMVMPVKDGLKTILELRRVDPAIPLIPFPEAALLRKNGTSMWRVTLRVCVLFPNLFPELNCFQLLINCSIRPSKILRLNQ